VIAEMALTLLIELQIKLLKGQLMAPDLSLFRASAALLAGSRGRPLPRVVVWSYEPSSEKNETSEISRNQPHTLHESDTKEDKFQKTPYSLLKIGYICLHTDPEISNLY